MALENSDMNYAVIVNSDNIKADVQIYENRKAYKKGFDPVFDRKVLVSFYCGEVLNEKYKKNKGDNKKNLRDHMDELISETIEEQAVENPDKFKVTLSSGVVIKGDWKATK